ncbi:hypothetical protein SELMODRAFT_451408 [Selaginella moellendorffii]|uniref:Uncharacterized protein IP5P3-2 n=1 Tax=Selaginella moellendorffii TaxID=88036 RepID=D8R2I7_SELML|nr:hypothetical protein SELMODRAFT_451408 [Selaginella moellendorffii]
MPTAMERSSSRRSESFWPTSAVKKLFNLGADANVFSADEDEDNSVRNRKVFRRYSESGISHTHFTYNQNFSFKSVFAGTWNVAGKPPADDIDLSEWLLVKDAVDIYVVGFQEIVPLNPGNVLGAEDEGPATKWEAIIRRTLNGDRRQTKSAPSSPWREGVDDNSEASPDHTETSQPENFNKHKKAYSSSELEFGSSTQTKTSYVRMISKQMVGIFITVWVRKDLRQYIHNVKVSCVGCGLMGYYGNKGSVAVSMNFDQTSFCFVCTHLTSGEREGDELRRHSDVIEILRRTTFSKSDDGSPASILAHDRVLWLGDLNYRLSLSNGETKTLLESENWSALLQKDQLKLAQSVGGVFHGWQEGAIEFAPTYKYKANSTEYSNGGEKQRTPAWCDRVLWKGKGLRQINYYRTEYTFSDHRPVTAMFVAEVELLKRRGPLRAADDASTLDFKKMHLGIVPLCGIEEKRRDSFLLPNATI